MYDLSERRTMPSSLRFVGYLMLNCETFPRQRKHHILLFANHPFRLLETNKNSIMQDCKEKCFELLKTKQVASPFRRRTASSHLWRVSSPNPTLQSFLTYRAQHLEFQLLGLLPSEALVAEVAVLGSSAVDGVDEIELLDNNTGSEIEILVDDVDQFFAALVARSVCLDEQARWLRNSNGVGKLHECSSRQFSIDQRLGDPSCQVGSAAVDLAVVFARERASSVGSPAAIGVDDDLPASQTSISLWPTDDEET
jgi:hypothetical protein